MIMSRSCGICSESICQQRQPVLPTLWEHPRREVLLSLPGNSQLCQQICNQAGKGRSNWLNTGSKARLGPASEAESVLQEFTDLLLQESKEPAMWIMTDMKRTHSPSPHCSPRPLFFFFNLTIFYSLHLEIIDKGRYNFRICISGVNNWCYFLY